MGERLRGKTAIVFGAGSSGPGWGNGKAASVAYAREGAAVICADLSRASAEETAQIIAGEGGRALALDADVTTLASVERAVAAGLAWSAIDILHNNVGVVLQGGPLEIGEEQFRRSLDLNLGSVYRTARALLPHFLERGRGAITNISSLAAIRWTGYPYFAYYAAKAAVNQATVALAMQYAGRGIRANAILPGMIDTPLIYAQISDQYDFRGRAGRGAEPGRADGAHGHGVGRGERRRVPGIGRGRVHHGSMPAGGRRTVLRDGELGGFGL